MRNKTQALAQASAPPRRGHLELRPGLNGLWEVTDSQGRVIHLEAQEAARVLARLLAALQQERQPKAAQGLYVLADYHRLEPFEGKIKKLPPRQRTPRNAPSDAELQELLDLL